MAEGAKSKREKWTFRLAIFGALLSVATAAASGYQWWNSAREANINAAIEVSKNYLKDNDTYNTAVQLTKLSWNNGFVISDEQYKSLRLVTYLEYISLLINNSKLNVDYVSDTLKCDIHTAGGMLRNFRTISNFEVLTPELDSLSKTIACKVFIRGHPHVIAMPPPPPNENANK